MSTQLYRITRRGAQHVRFEWPNGERVKGPRYTYEGGKHVPIHRHGGPAQKVIYGAHRVDRNTGLPVPGVRSEIRLTSEGARALKHLGLVPIVGSGADKVKVEGIDPSKLYSGNQVAALVSAINTEVQAGATVIGTAGEGNGDDDKVGEPDPAFKVPVDWREMSESRKRGIAAKISGQPKADITAEQASTIIEAHVAAQSPSAG